MPSNMQVLLASRPTGWVEESNFRIVETPIPKPEARQLLIKIHWLSLDPYMRGRMSTAKSYVKPVEVGEVMTGGTVGEVIESSNPKFKTGDYVVGSLGWQQYAVSDGEGLTKVDPKLVPLPCYVGGRHAAVRPGSSGEHCQPRPAKRWCLLLQVQSECGRPDREFQGAVRWASPAASKWTTW
jgi:NADPH-dependent curcumin reductase CurA